MHPRNRHKNSYDFDRLSRHVPALKHYLKTNKYQQVSIDFSHSDAVTCLNQAILASDYNIAHWSIPQGFLCPPIPGRVDYIHYVADLLKHSNNNRIPKHAERVRLLDIGCGANVIFPLLAHRVYQWQATGVDIDPVSVANADKIIRDNQLQNAINIKLQTDANTCFANVISADDRVDITMCNPPFHDSLATAIKANERKWQKLAAHKRGHKASYTGNTTPAGKQTPNSKLGLNFGGQKAELYCEGGELRFVRRMIMESKYYAQQVLWFTCLVSNKDNLRALKQALKKVKAVDSRTITMRQGQKTSRFIAWSFHTKQQQHDWCYQRFTE